MVKPPVQPQTVRTRKLAPELRGVGWGPSCGVEAWVGTKPGGPRRILPAAVLGLEASAHPLPPGCGTCTPPPTGAHRARTGRHCTRTHTPMEHTHPNGAHTGTRARSHTPPSARRLLPAAPPPAEPDSGTRAPERRLDGPGQQPSVPAGDQVGLAIAGAGAGTPRLRPPRPAPRPPPIGGQRRGLQRGGRTLPLRMRTGAALWGDAPGGGCRAPAGRWKGCGRPCGSA